MSQPQAEQAVVGSQGGLVMPLGDAGSDRSSRRRRRVRSDRVWSAMR